MGYGLDDRGSIAGRIFYNTSRGASRSVVVEALSYKLEGRGIASR
jgi:hypothetical protein